MANKPLQTIKFPGLTDTYTVPQVDSNFVGTAGQVPDSKKVHDEIDSLKEDLNASEVMINIANGRIKNVPIERSGAIGNLSVSYSYGRVTLNGSASTAIVLEADADRITETPNGIAYRQGINSGLIEDNTGCRKNPFTPGRYRLVFRMLSGTVTKNGVTYASNEDFGNVNVVNAFLLKADATTSSYTLIKKNVTTEVDLNVDAIGLQVLYIYSGCSFTNAVFELYLEPYVEENVPDTTLTEEGKAADAKSAGDAIRANSYELDDAEVAINESVGKVKNAPLNRSGVAGELTVVYKYGKITLNGSITENNIVLEADSDRVYTGVTWAIPYRQGFTSGIFDDNALARKVPIQTGRYRLVFNMLSGRVMKGDAEYTSNKQFGKTNVVNAFLLKADATSESYTLVKTNTTAEISLDVTQIGMQVLYCYKGVTFDNAVFELYVEKVTEESDEDAIIPTYWNEEIDRAVAQIQSNIVNASGTNSTTVCFVTDCHWRNNQKWSPHIIKKLFSKCNINYFVNGGDLLQSHTSTKQAAMDEMMDCINAFRICGKPMITLYGNHDRNRNNNTDHAERLMSHSEHANVVFKSFMPSPHIHRITPDYTCFYWEDDVYRYACIYWFFTNEASRANSFITELMDTSKPVVIFYHGIYFTLAADPAEDTIDNRWILNAFEPYKSQIKCIIQGHTHRDGLRHAWETVPVIIIDCDTIRDSAEIGTIAEQSMAVITLDTDQISVVKVGKGEDFIVTADSTDWRQEYITPEEEDETS